MAISCLGFNTIDLFSRQIFKIDDAPVNYPLLWYFDFVLRRWFVQSLETLPWEITKIFDWLANILNQSERSVRWRTDRLKKAHRPCRLFFKLLQRQYPHGFGLSALPRLLLSAPNQNRHATQARNSLFHSLHRSRAHNFILDRFQTNNTLIYPHGRLYNVAWYKH